MGECIFDIKSIRGDCMCEKIKNRKEFDADQQAFKNKVNTLYDEWCNMVQKYLGEIVMNEYDMIDDFLVEIQCTLTEKRR